MEANNNTSFSSLCLHNELNNSHYDVTKQVQIEKRKRKAYCDISRTQQWKNKNMLATYLEKSSTFLNSSRPHIKKFVDLDIKCQIRNVIDLILRDLMCPDKERIFKRLNILDYIQEHEKRKNFCYMD
jgi:hypothetical protein